MRTGTARNEQLDGLRGYAALAVIYFHSILGADDRLVDKVLHGRYSDLTSASDWVTKIALVLFNGQTAVVFFFIMSGAVLFESLMRDKAPMPLRLRDFAVRRFFRIYPALFVCLICCWLAFNAFGIAMSAEDLLLNLSLYEIRVNGATWTLAVEAWGAVLLALCFVAYLRFKELGLIAVAALFGCLYLQPFSGYFVQFKMFIYCFALGALIPTSLGRAVVSKIPSWAWPLLLVATIMSKATIQETFASLLVGMIYYRRAGAMGEFLSKPISLFLGSVSYSLYLFNVMFLEIISSFIRSANHFGLQPALVGLVSGTIIAVLTLPVAYASLKYLEEPFIRLGRRLTSSNKTVPSPSDLVSPSVIN